MLKIIITLFLTGFLTGTLSAQTTLHFQPILDEEPLVLGAHNEEQEGAGAGTMKVEVLRFYLSDLSFLRNGKAVFIPKKRHHLLDAEKHETLGLKHITPPDLNYNEIRFTLGVDSLTAASGAFGGDLDPTSGMYWTWRSGYINFKLEGTAPDCPARKNRFQFHVGGFQGPFASQREVRLAVIPASDITIMVDLDRFFAAVNLKEQYQVMSPNAISAEMADLLAELFRVE